MQRPVAVEPIAAFRDPEGSLGRLPARNIAAALTVAADISLVLDDEGVILDLAYSSAELAREGCSAWVGLRWVDTVAPETRSKVEEMLAAARAGPPDVMATPRQVTVLTPRGGEAPVRFVVTPLGEGRLLAVGREMRSLAALQHRLVEAQHAAEREYSRLRDTEMRYRLMFQMTGEAMLIVDAATRRIVEANPAAERLLANSGRRLVGRAFPAGVAAEDAGEIDRLAARARATGRAEGVTVRLIDGESVAVSAALFRQEASAFLLFRISGGQGGSATVSEEAGAVAAIVAAAPEAYVATDEDGVIRWFNTAFLNLAQLATEEQAQSQPLDRFLGRPGIDIAVLIQTLRETGAVRLFTTTMRGDFGSTTEVEISAARADVGDAPLFGFLLRPSEARRVAQGENPLPRSVEQLTELVGRVPLKDLVRETTDVIERLCIEAALELTSGNRASAAEMLGLSRQSLYVKLRRYGIGDEGDEHD